MRSLLGLLLAILTFVQPAAAQVRRPWISPGISAALRSAPKPYLGAIGTGTRINNSVSTTNLQFMNRTGHYARSTVAGPQVVWAAYATSGANKAEAAPAGTVTWKGSIEYPASSGTCYPMTFSGASSLTTSGITTVISDPVMNGANPLVITNGDLFQVRAFTDATNGTSYSTYAPNATVAIGEVNNFAASGIVDRTVDCSTIPSSGFTSRRPAAIIGMTTAPAILVIGDSQTIATGDTAGDITTNSGSVARSIGPYYGYIGDGTNGTTATNYIASHTEQLKLGRYASAVVVELGVNDITNGQTLAQIQTSLQTIWGYYSGKQVFQTTITPSTTSTDLWATLANQTAATNFSTAGNGTREQLNDWTRAVPTGLAGALDISSAVESSLNSGKWKVTGANNYCTADGLHATPACYLLMQSSGVISPTPFLRPGSANDNSPNPAVRILREAWEEEEKRAA